MSGHTPFSRLLKETDLSQGWCGVCGGTHVEQRHGLGPIAMAMAGIEEDPVPPPAPEHMELLRDALQLIQELWPHPYSASITLETHQWVKLRKVLLSIPDLLAEAER